MKIDDAAARLEALGNPTRLKIYRTLVRAGHAGLSVGRLQERLKIPASTLSHHVKGLVAVGLVSQVREGTTLVCHAQYDTMRSLVKFLVAECCAEEAECGAAARPAAYFFDILFDDSRNIGGRMSGGSKTVAIIGSGPVGLAAAAHVLERGMTPIVLEAGPEAAHSVRQWRHVQLFSPWEYNVDRAAARLLVPTGWNSPDPQVYPTGGELVEQYIEPLATRTALRDVIRTNSRVTAVGRVGFDKAKTKGREAAPFEIRYQNGKGPQALRADAVIDASGTWASPNPAGAGGLPAIGEREAASRIAYGMPDVLGKDRSRYADKTVAVLGGGHSAIGTLTDLVALAQQEPSTRPIWLLRSGNPEKSFGGGANDKLSARGELGAHFASLIASGQVQVEAGFPVAAIAHADGRLRIATSSACCGRSIVADELVVATGFRPDFSFLSEIRLRLDPAIDAPVALAPLIDPNEHSSGTVRPHGARELEQDDRGFYLAGMKAYGRAPTFLMMTG